MNISELPNLREHLKSRHLDLDLHRPAINEEERIATFYLWNLSGSLVGFQQYRPEGLKKINNDPREGKYYTYKKQPTIAVWGVESLYLSPHVVFITEGVFDAARLTERGYSALAMLTNNPTTDYRNWLTFLNRTVVAVCDNDKAGKKLAAFGDVAIFTEEKDLGDSDDEYVTNLLLPYKLY
jgi:hypothetical protein